MNYTDDVNGQIIGDITNPYEFWIEDEFGYLHKLDKGHFANDEEAKEWVKTHYPAEYKKGVEMRCFDR